MPSYTFTPEALDDLNSIVLYTIEKWGKSQAKHYVDGLNLLANRLAQTPQIGSNRNEFNARLLSFPYGSHILFYAETLKGISIIRVLHKNMDTRKHL